MPPSQDSSDAFKSISRGNSRWIQSLSASFLHIFTPALFCSPGLKSAPPRIHQTPRATGFGYKQIQRTIKIFYRSSNKCWYIYYQLILQREYSDTEEIPFVENEGKSLIKRYIFYIACIAAVSLLLREVMSPKIILLLLLLVVTRACLVLLVMGSRKKRGAPFPRNRQGR